jgi:hypothetical protein
MKKITIFIISLCLLFTLSTNIKADFFTDVIVTSSNGIWTDSRAYSNLPAAIDAVGSLQRTVAIVSQQYVGNMTVPSNVTLKFERDGAIINSGQLTFNTKNIIADNRQILAGSGDVDFASGTVVKSGWFSNIERALTVTSDDSVTIIVSKAQAIATSCSVGNNVTLKWETSGNLLTANAGVIVSNVNKIESGDYQIFAGAGDFDFIDGATLNLKWFDHFRSALTQIESIKATLIIPGSNTIAYSDSVPSNIYLDFITRQGVFSISPGITLTFDSPNNIVGVPNHRIFTSTGIATFTNAGTVYPEWWGGLTDFTTDNSVAIAKMMTDLGATWRGIIHFNYGLKFAAGHSAATGIEAIITAMPIGAIIHDYSGVNRDYAADGGETEQKSFRVITRDTTTDDTYFGVVSGHHPALILNNTQQSGTPSALSAAASLVFRTGLYGRWAWQQSVDDTNTRWLMTLNTGYNYANVYNQFGLLQFGSDGRMSLGGGAPTAAQGSLRFYNRALDTIYSVYLDNPVAGGSTYLKLYTKTAGGVIKTSALYADSTGVVTLYNGAKPGPYITADADKTLIDDLYTSGIIAHTWTAIAGATPTVTGGSFFRLTQVGATDVLGFAGFEVNQEITIRAGDGNSTLKHNNAGAPAGCKLYLQGSADILLTTNSIITFVRDESGSAIWIEKSRSIK